MDKKITKEVSNQVIQRVKSLKGKDLDNYMG